MERKAQGIAIPVVVVVDVLVEWCASIGSEKESGNGGKRTGIGESKRMLPLHLIRWKGWGIPFSKKWLLNW